MRFARFAAQILDSKVESSSSNGQSVGKVMSQMIENEQDMSRSKDTRSVDYTALSTDRSLMKFFLLTRISRRPEKYWKDSAHLDRRAAVACQIRLSTPPGIRGEILTRLREHAIERFVLVWAAYGTRLLGLWCIAKGPKMSNINIYVVWEIILETNQEDNLQISLPPCRSICAAHSLTFNS